MENKITGNEPALVETEKDRHPNYTYGLTIRQHFAAMVLQGMLSNTMFTDLVMKKVAVGKQAQYLSQAAVEQADALIAELNKQTPA